MSRILFAGGGTGGHLYPALALGSALTAERPDLEIHYVGAERGVEARVLPQLGRPHTLLPLEPLRRSRPWENWRLVPSTLSALRGLRRLFHEFDPQLIVGTGGYASGLVCAYGVRRGVPLALHEQNSFPGLATRILARYARQVHLGFPEAEAFLRPGAATEIQAPGNAIVPPATRIERTRAAQLFGFDPAGVVVLIVGGSQGSLALNEALIGALEMIAEEELPTRPEGLQILWSTGPAHIDSIERRLARLDLGWVRPFGYIDSMSEALALADLAVSRAGAIGTAELLAWGVPAILVPLPTAAADHQTENARSLEAAGAAIHLPERELTPARLWSELIGLVGDTSRREALAGAALERARPDAAQEIARKLLELLEDDVGE